MLINKGILNKLVFTLTENVTLSPVYFLFRFVDDLEKKEYTNILVDTSLYIERYNEFEFTEGANEATTLPKGFYHYYIYEQDNDTNLDYKLSGSLLEVGKIKVVGETEMYKPYEYKQEYKSYRNE
jgi:hypothetical protein